MCGLVTIVASEGKTVNMAILEKMTGLLAHRGPDDFGYAWIDSTSGVCRTWTTESPGNREVSGILFGHRRLSILDLTSAGHQPMVSEDGSTVLSYNGEIYNFVELRKELQLLAYPGAFRGFNQQNVVNFLAACLLDHDNTTLFREIYAVPPGTYMELAGQRATQHQFWSLPSKVGGDTRPAGELVDQFGALLADSVRLRVRSDVPIGTMLSGGLDSTSITALIHEQHRLSDSGRTESAFEGLRSFHHTFSACWPGWQNNEEVEVDLLCAELGLLSHKVYPTGEMLADVLSKVIYCLEEPFETPTALVQYLLMRKAKDHGLKVVLNGHGSDEILAGYPGFFVPPFLAGLLLSGRPAAYLRQRNAFRSNREWSQRHVVEEVLAALLPTALRPRLDELFFPDDRRNQMDLFSEVKPWSRLGRSGLVQGVAPHMSPLNSSLWLKFSEKILPMWLRMEDRVSMASSVESRLPFLDYRLVEFAFNLPDNLKLKDGYTKYILRQAMKDKLPARIAFNQVKQRFATPFHEWFRGSWRPLIEDLLLGPVKCSPILTCPNSKKAARVFGRRQPRASGENTLAGSQYGAMPQNIFATRPTVA